MEDLEKQLKASLGKLLAPLRKEHDKAVRLHSEHKLKAEQYYSQSRWLNLRIGATFPRTTLRYPTVNRPGKTPIRGDGAGPELQARGC